MADGIKKTVQLLAQSKNKAAQKLLKSALSSSLESVRKTTGREIVQAQGARGISDLIRQFEPSDADMVGIFQDNRDKVLPALRSAIISKDADLSQKALRIAHSLEFFEQIPLLLDVFLSPLDTYTPDDVSALEDTILQLVRDFVGALAQEPTEKQVDTRSLHQTVLPEVLGIIAKVLEQAKRDIPPLILRVYLACFPFAPRDRKDFFVPIRQPNAIAYLPLYHLLLSDDDPIIYAFLFHCLDHVNPPPVVFSIVAKRADAPFLTFLLGKMDEHISDRFLANITRSQLDWLGQTRDLLPQLDGVAQSGLIKLVERMKIPEGVVQSLLREVFRSGAPLGRCQALSTMVRYDGEKGDQTLWQAAEDRDPDVQALALTLLSQRNMPNSLGRIVQFADSPHQKVRETVWNLVPQYRLSGLIHSFDQMTEEQRHMGFNLVRSLDPVVIDELSDLLMTGTTDEKINALLCVEYGDLTLALEDSICAVLTMGENTALRAKAAELLVQGQRHLSRGALVQALHRDPSKAVRDAAKASLEKRPAPWNKQDTTT